MKQLYLVMLPLLCLCPVRLSAQVGENRTKSSENPAEKAEIYLQVLRPAGLEIFPEGTEIVWEQLKEAVVLNEIQSNTSPFAVESHIRLLSCQATPSVPVQWIAEVEITCSVTDRIRGRILQQTSFYPKGISSDKKKAILTALKQIKARHPQLKKLILEGKAKILSARASEKPTSGASSGEQSGESFSAGERTFSPVGAQP